VDADPTSLCVSGTFNVTLIF
jgi:hypothetical protein